MATSSDNARESREAHTLLEQRSGALAYAAQGTPLGGEATQRLAAPPSGQRLVISNALGAAQATAQQAPPQSCQQCLTLNFFFDGTGNNLDADVGSMQHSNVARLFMSRQDDNPDQGLYSFYVYGLGTYFKEIGDPGNTARGKGMGAMGQDRIDWAMRKLDEAIKKAEARAQNPTNKITSIRLSVFGFSRGATLARAFVQDLAKRCTQAPGRFRLKMGGYPIEVIFLGLFDTVASVGLPMSANNTPGATTAGWYSVSTTVDIRASSTECGLRQVAFGDPGADPAPGDFDGHASWADGLQVLAPDFVKRCVHMVAGHEIRNSFPSDSVLDGKHYPSGTVEMVYPGAHSDVGGGYQPGEGARSPHPGDMLSLIPLRAMHAEALAAGVALRNILSLSTAGTDIQKRSFALDPEGHFSKPRLPPTPMSRHDAGHDHAPHQALGLLASPAFI